MKLKSPEMKLFCGLSCMILLLPEASSKEIVHSNLLSVTFCESSLSVEDNMRKKTLEEVHTYAEPKEDPRASFLNLSRFVPP